MRIVNWNVRWATPRSPRRPEILRRMEAHEPEVVCLTETDVALLPWDGHVVCSLADYGYEAPKNRRKVLLWSRQPWRDVDQMGDPDMPPGRFVPCNDADVAGRPDRHGRLHSLVGVAYRLGVHAEAREGGRITKRTSKCLGGLLAGTPRQRLVVVGDFNQRVRQGPAPVSSRVGVARGGLVAPDDCDIRARLGRPPGRLTTSP